MDRNYNYEPNGDRIDADQPDEDEYQPIMKQRRKTIATQTCIQCQCIKPLNEYHVSGTSHNGKQSRCIECAALNLRRKEHHLARIDRMEDYLRYLMEKPIDSSTIYELEQRQKCRGVIRRAGKWMMRAIPTRQEVAE